MYVASDIFRVIARAQLKSGYEEQGKKAAIEEQVLKRKIEEGQLMTICCFHWQRNLFIYMECVGEQLDAEELMSSVNPYLEWWPGHDQPRKWISMIDVFHFNRPASVEHWKRKTIVEQRVGRVAHLKPEMVASYIYYHYQLQEEQAFYGPKYEIIAMHENLLFGYQEFPNLVEAPAIPGVLKTTGTPENWNDSRMDLHFQPWPDGHLYFKPVETVFTYYSHGE